MKIKAVIILSLILTPSLSYAYSDRDEPDIYAKQSQYSPGWVMDSVYSPKAEAGMKDSVDKLNKAENTQAIKQKTNDNPDATAESKLPLKKKKSGGESKSNKTPLDNNPPDDKNVVHGYKVNDAGEYFTTPEEARQKFEEGVAKSPLANGKTYSLSVPGTDYTMNIWQDGDNAVFNITNQNGTIIRDKTYCFSVNRYWSQGGEYGNPEQTFQSFLTETPAEASYYNGDKIELKVTGMYYGYVNYGKVLGGMPGYGSAGYIYYSGEDEKMAFNLHSETFSSLAGFVVVLSENYVITDSVYSFDNGKAGWDWFTMYGAGPTGNPISGSTNITPTLYTSSPTTPTLSSFTPSPYRPYSKYEDSYFDDSYNQYKTHPNNDQGIISSSNKAKDDKSLTDKALDKANSNISPNSLNKDNINDYKLNNPYLIDLSSLDPSSLKTKTTELEDMILILDNKESKTKIEENILIVARAIEENMAYLDEKTIKDFNEVVRIVQAIEDMKSMISELDFANIAKSLTNLVEEERSMYNDYLKSSENIYENIIKLLGLNLDDLNLPDAYIALNEINTMAKKKIAVDMVIERLKAKDAGKLTDNQKSVLMIDRELLSPIRGGYISKLKIAVTEFVWHMRDIIKDKAPVSIVSNQTSLKTMFILEDQPKK